jgi:hypothetical protein
MRRIFLDVLEICVGLQKIALYILCIPMILSDFIATSVGLVLYLFVQILELFVELVVSVLSSLLCLSVLNGDYKFLFMLSVLVYSGIYSDFFSKSYISKIYERDKYGVVLNYTYLSFMAFFTEHIYIVADVIETNRRNPLQILRDESLISCLFFLVKCFLFNMIFKNNTSDDDPTHENVHLVFVFLLGIVSCLHVMACRPVIERRDRRISVFCKLIKLLVFSYLYDELGKMCLLIGNSDKFFNIMTSVMGSLAIQETIGTNHDTITNKILDYIEYNLQF